jgi:hypothetical protein
MTRPKPEQVALEDPLLVSVESQDADPDAPECRICLSCEDPDQDMMEPCKCAGSCATVHRKCLNRWRAMKTNPRAFTHCPNCAFEYRLRLQRTEEADGGCMTRKRKFRLLVARDTLKAFALTQVVVLLAAGLVYLCDQDHVIRTEFDNYFNSPADKSVYYGAGLLLVFFLMGMSAICAACCSGGQDADTSDSFYCYYFYGDFGSGSDGGDCNCSDGDCGCPTCGGDGGEDAGGFAIVALVIVAIVIVAGAVLAVFAGLFILQRAIQRHQHVLQKTILAEEYIVVDRSEWCEHGYSRTGSWLGPPGTHPSAPELETMARPDRPEPSAPAFPAKPPAAAPAAAMQATLPLQVSSPPPSPPSPPSAWACAACRRPNPSEHLCCSICGSKRKHPEHDYGAFDPSGRGGSDAFGSSSDPPGGFRTSTTTPRGAVRSAPHDARARPTDRHGPGPGHQRRRTNDGRGVRVYGRLWASAAADPSGAAAEDFDGPRSSYTSASLQLEKDMSMW